jgi:hypothetical protein
MRDRIAPLAILSSLALLGLASTGCIVGSRSAFSEPGDDRAVPPPPVATSGPAVDDDDEDEDTADAPPEALPPRAPVDRAAVDQKLAGHGHWVDTPEYGRVWIPDRIAQDWQPYTNGHWVWTEYGWSFVSDDPWGLVTYHYGRWGFYDDLGWFWVPGYVWGPAWVSWRWAEGFACWSALGPRGFHYGRRWPGWVAVPAHAFTERIVANRIAQPGAIVRSARPVHGLGPGLRFGGNTGGHMGHSGHGGHR